MPLQHSGSDAAFKTNVKTLMGEVGKSPHVQSREQALAIAYATKRRGKADGGKVDDTRSIQDTVRMQNLLVNALGKNPKPVNRDMGGALIQPFSQGYMQRSEARGMTHSGPIMSTVPGRTDKHNMHVKSGSYVAPADFVSHLGQSNSMAGANLLNHMFKMGPYSSALPKAKMGAGPPKPPKVSGVMQPPPAPKLSGLAPADRGGARGSSIGVPTPIVAAGGEVVIPPEHILGWMGRNGMQPDIKNGHKMLDKWVMKTRKEHIKTLKKLPPPARS